ncbi:uncharacterized protein LOC133203414 [Saccostrea echinata]|uniref:uncharacterized protein LOC133203414 n=1 Tax=Saccostrea echinata TaxID=191078 RepID=UPI002A8051EF|nr:uncharacterized protein LOC133203414 [Saccostrea echinata]
MISMSMKCSNTVFLWILGSSVCMAAEMAKLDGDIFIGGLFKIFEEENGDCSNRIDIASIRDYEAVKWTLNTLNSVGYIPGVNIGIEAFSTCNIPGRAIHHTVSFVQKALENGVNVSSQAIIGIMGPESSSEAEVTSRFISSLEAKHQLYQLLFSATTANLSDKRFQNILRVIPNDKLQSEVMQKLLNYLDWNYVAVVYENTAYGRGAFEEFSQLAKHVGICIPKSFSLQTGKTANVDLSAIRTVLDQLLSNAESQITGAIFFASTSTVSTFLDIAQARKQATNFGLVMVFSESVALEKSMFDQYDSVSKGSFVTSPPAITVEDFLRHWESIMANKTRFVIESRSNPWLFDAFRRYQSCDPSSDVCSMPTIEEVRATESENIFESYAIMATLIQVNAIRVLHSERCGGANGICSGLKTILLQSKNTLIKKDFYEMTFDTLPFSFPTNFSVIVNGSNDALLVGNISSYEIYQYRSCLSQNNKFCMEKVAGYDKGSLDIQRDRLASYDDNVESEWPNIHKAQCFPGKNCASCKTEDTAKEIYFEEGELYVVGVAPIYNGDASNPLRCGDIREMNGWEITEAMSYAVSKINLDKDIFPETKIGYIILNSCNQPVMTTKALLDMLDNDNGVMLTNGTFLRNISSKILAFVAELGSSISQASAKVLQEFNFVQVAYGSTAAVLSNREEYKYFLRLCTPDTNQAKAMVNLLHDLNSSYIQILYSEGTYGEGGRDQVVQLAKAMNICIANSIKVEENKYTRILDDLRKKPYANIVLLFLKSHVVFDVVTLISTSMEFGEFHFIASEAFGTRSDIVNNNPKLDGTLSLSLELAMDYNELQHYIYDKLQKNDNQNPWTRSYFEKKYNCYLPSSFDKSSNTKCSGVLEEYNSTEFKPNTWSPFALYAITTVLKGTYAAFQKFCGQKSEKICIDYRNKPNEIWEFVKQQKLLLNGVLTSIFDENGDGNLGHVIYQTQKSKSDPQKFDFIKIGSYSNGLNYTIGKNTTIDKADVFSSVCPHKKECDICTEFFGRTPTQSTVASPKEGSDFREGATIGLGVLAGVLFLIIIAMIFIIRRGFCTPSNQSDHYASANDFGSRETYLTAVAENPKNLN